MPILSRETNLFPADLLDRVQLGRGSEEGWIALYTHSRQEKQLMRKLCSLELSFYSPIITRRQPSPAGRVRESFLPLFPNYVFLYGDELARYRALTTGCVAQTLVVTDPEPLTSQLRQIQRLLASGQDLLQHPRLQPGAKVRIARGTLEGIEGCVIREHGETRLLVAVDFVQQGASMLIDESCLESIG